MTKIAEKAELMDKGTWFVTLTKKLPGCYIKEDETSNQNANWECVHSIKRVMSWGHATVNIHYKRK